VERRDEAVAIRAAQRRNPEGIGALYREHADSVYQTAYRLMGSRSDAQDVLQDVFAGLPRALGSYRDQGSFAGWLRTVATRTALMRLRATRRKREVDFDVSEAETAIGGALVEIEPLDRIAISAALAGMPESLRLVFMLREVEGYSHGEVGELLGISARASATRLSRAWNVLRKELML
jgi:RNA polymerase sigma-70 factor (ECF subfamily)